MEQKRVMTGENGETDGDGEYQELKNLVQNVKNEKENVWELFFILSSANSVIAQFVFIVLQKQQSFFSSVHRGQDIVYVRYLFMFCAFLLV